MCFFLVFFLLFFSFLARQITPLTPWSDCRQFSWPIGVAFETTTWTKIPPMASTLDERIKNMALPVDLSKDKFRAQYGTFESEDSQPGVVDSMYVKLI
jgi:hypothetical protein